jgi:hypothetical protein
MQIIVGFIILVVIIVGRYKYLSTPAAGPSTVSTPPARRINSNPCPGSTRTSAEALTIKSAGVRVD